MKNLNELLFNGHGNQGWSDLAYWVDALKFWEGQVASPALVPNDDPERRERNRKVCVDSIDKILCG